MFEYKFGSKEYQVSRSQSIVIEIVDRHEWYKMYERDIEQRKYEDLLVLERIQQTETANL